MSIQKTYNVSTQKQLIDLNGNLVNFELEFIAQSKNGEPFEILVVDQAILDSQHSLPYKKAVDGKISGNILADKNIYQNYFLIIRAENDCEVNVTINKKELPIVQQPEQYYPIYPPQQENYQPQQYMQPQPQSMQPQSMQPPQPMKNNKNSSNLKFYLIIGLIGLGVAYYFFYYKKKKNNTENYQVKTSIPEVEKSHEPAIPKSPTPLVVKSPIPTTPIPTAPIPTTPIAVPYNTTLLDRLNSLKF
jgi:hypothetical protein